jgi:dTDP-4-amino-4,6-dideoxygalactose transaminase
MSNNVIDELERVLYSGFIGEGPEVLNFEKKISEKLEVPYVLTMNSGTSCLHIAYQMISNYDENSEAIVSPMTCAATLTPLIANKIKIVWADINPETGNIDPLDVERKITKNTKMIILVHWGGVPCEIEKFLEISKKYNIPLVEDGAHSLGSTYNKKYIGSFSDFTMFSLQAIKNINSVDGGILICKEQKYYERAKLLRWYGISREINAKQTKDLRCELDVSEAGHKMHMNDVCATIGSANFHYLDVILQKHRSNAEYYNLMFKDKVKHVIPPENSNPSWWLYTLLVENRDELMEKLKQEGIMSSKVHARNDTHSMFKDFKKVLPGVDKFNDTHLCIPVHWALTEQERETIVNKVLEYAK